MVAANQGASLAVDRWRRIGESGMKMKTSKLDFVKIFEAHGVGFTGRRGNQLYGYCPFSEKDDKFYVNLTNGLWDSKSTGLSGNVYKFMALRGRYYRTQLCGVHLRRLSENRQLPRDAFREWEVGWDGR